MTEAPNAGRRLLHLFATPVIIDELEAAAELNAELEAVILARMASDPGLRLSNQGGWQSTHDLHVWADAAGKRILAHAAALATANTAADQGSGIRWAVDGWANVSTPAPPTARTFTAAHSGRRSIMSGSETAKAASWCCTTRACRPSGCMRRASGSMIAGRRCSPRSNPKRD